MGVDDVGLVAVDGELSAHAALTVLVEELAGAQHLVRLLATLVLVMLRCGW